MGEDDVKDAEGVMDEHGADGVVIGGDTADGIAEDISEDEIDGKAAVIAGDRAKTGVVDDDLLSENPAAAAMLVEIADSSEPPAVPGRSKMGRGATRTGKGAVRTGDGAVDSTCPSAEPSVGPSAADCTTEAGFTAATAATPEKLVGRAESATPGD